MEEYVTPAEPHFDDEQTLRAAQPVVPLEKINAKTRHRRHWFLGGAFAIAMMLGAASALLASYFKLRHVPSATVEVSAEPDVAPAPLAVTETAAATTPEPEDLNAAAAPVEETAPPITPRKEPVVRHRTVVARPNPQPAEPRDTQLNEDEELHRIRQAVLVDEWQERRARRVERRERRRQERYNHRDLSNLDEIFEGRRRP
jgi:hypothetical protein